MTIMRIVHPEQLSHLWALAAAGVFLGNEVAAQGRLRSGRRPASAALIADGNHARTNGFVSLGVVASAIVVALGAPIADPIVGCLRITWQSWRGELMRVREAGVGRFSTGRCRRAAPRART